MTTSAGAAGARPPRFSIVSAVYNVEPYLPAFIESIEALRIGAGDLEIVAVDDGSTDASLDLLREWGGRSRHRVRIYTKPNGGQASARNVGLDHATGEWVTFTDPDDMLDRDFFSAAGRFADAHPTIEVLSSRPVLLLGDPPRLRDGHPRRRQYSPGTRVVDLRDEPSIFLGVSSGSLFRLDRIRDLGLRFDPRIRPNFEDAQFAVRFILDLPAPTLGLLHDAVYIYRKRASRDSTLQSSLSHAGKYAEVLELGYLDVMERGRMADGTIAPWIQQLIVYELSWYLSADEAITTDIRIEDAAVPRFHELFGAVVRNLDPEIIASHRGRRLHAIWQHVLEHGYRDEPWHMDRLVRTKFDAAMGLQRVAYRYTGRRPAETVLVDGQPVQPAYEKIRAHRYFQRSLVYERVLWLPALDELEVQLDGIPVPIERRWRPPSGWRHPRRTWRDRLWLYRRLPLSYLPSAAKRRLRRKLIRRASAALRLIAKLPPYRWQFRDAWILMDRVTNADDNAERLFEHLQRERPDLNAWFVVSRDSPDFQRMEAAGVRRLVAWGSWRWRMLLVHGHWLVSSHADVAIARPPAIVRLARRWRWKYAFLNHGVIKDDLSLWLNNRDIDLFIVSTTGELESVAGDGSSYLVTHKETRNTGLARFDRLLDKGRGVEPEDRDLILIAPTWRTHLAKAFDATRQVRVVDPNFRESDYYRNWESILRSDEIAAAAARRGWRVGFMPHPNMQQVLPLLDLPDHIEPLTFADNDVQGLYARCALLVTDYSSVAFNAAYLDRPLVYFQFDFEEMMSGGHMGRRGYFDYERDGFGPVARDSAGAIRAIVASIEAGPQPAAEYQARIDRTFVRRDGGNSARIVAAIEELSRPYEAPAS